MAQWKWGKEPKEYRWNNEVKTVVRRKEAAWKVLGARDEEAKERCIEAYRRKSLKGVYIRAKTK